MDEQKRKQQRIKRSLSVQFCLANEPIRKWDQSIVDNISAGGLKFSATTELDLLGKIVRLRIRIPELAPQILDVEALVLEVKPKGNAIYCDIRAKFINLTNWNIDQLSILEKIINKQ